MIDGKETKEATVWRVRLLWPGGQRDLGRYFTQQMAEDAAIKHRASTLADCTIEGLKVGDATVVVDKVFMEVPVSAVATAIVRKIEVRDTADKPILSVSVAPVEEPIEDGRGIEL